jgi:DNA-binding MarR family transcriptional regulator
MIVVMAQESKIELSGGLQSLFAETTALIHRLKRMTQHVHQQAAGTNNCRGVLRSLSHQGPQTVPHLARSGKVSRQHVQTLVNRLVAEGHVEFVDNPVHQRSRLIRILPSGSVWLAAVTRREETHLTGLGIDLPEAEVRLATGVLRQLRELFDRADQPGPRKTVPTKLRLATPQRKVKSRKKKTIAPHLSMKVLQQPPAATVPEPSFTESGWEELPISML